MNRKMLVIGLDGVCWNLIGKWVENGVLPNIKRLKEEGSWGPMESCIPPITCPSWKCYSTGKNPGKLGVFWWVDLDLENKRVITPNSTSFKSKELWDYFNDAGYKTGIIGMPTRYPPKNVDGFLISGRPGCGHSGYTYPRELEEWLKLEFDYKTNPLTSVDRDKRDIAIEEVLKLIATNFDVAKALIEKKPINFLQVTSFHINGALQHFFYDGKPTRKAWKLIDEKIGELVPKFEYILIISDHGTSPLINNFFINAWLEKEGYLVSNRTFFDLIFKFGLNRDRILRLLDKLRLKEFLRRFEIFKSVSRQLLDQRGQLGEHAGEGISNRINWQETRVLGSLQGPLYINKDAMKKHEEYENLRAELINKLERLKDAENNKHIIQKVYKREEIYHGNYARQAPDLVVLDTKGFIKTVKEL
jgi:predicted AlkP superfamily phosphohydrolase/phosphomutase